MYHYYIYETHPAGDLDVFCFPNFSPPFFARRRRCSVLTVPMSQASDAETVPGDPEHRHGIGHFFWRGAMNGEEDLEM